jgi:hypothetical protein
MRKKSIPQYKWVAPVAFHGDRVNFRDHKGTVRYGTITHVQTAYGYHTHEAYHVFSVLIDGRQRCLNVGSKNIINVVK